MNSVTLVGPTHPFKGGVAKHTNDLALELARQGSDVEIESWRNQYPKRLYPGELLLPGQRAEGEIFEPATRRMDWFNPITWIQAGRRARSRDVVAVVLVTTVQIPVYLVLLAVARPRSVAVICHNVLPHEARPFDRPLVRALFRRADIVLTHTDVERERARELGAAEVRLVELPAHPPTTVVRSQVGATTHHRLLFFGFVREYKGLHILLDALQRIEGVSLTVAGELWGSRDEFDADLVHRGLVGRVDVEASYVPAADLPDLFSRHDALVLPYLSGTASQNVLFANQLGLPVIASAVGSFGSQVAEGSTGFLVEPGDVNGLVEAVDQLYAEKKLDQLRRAVAARPTGGSAWAAYIRALALDEEELVEHPGPAGEEQ
ncbi:MAG: glycosyltransferase involved in cell wall biosynthesis [Acidimicrobiales bacterium]|jgi:glycosyltransferase involved in cell wall biosynthesis